MAQDVYEIGKKIFTHAKKKDSAINLFNVQWWNKQMLALGMADQSLKDQLFRFVDVLPSLETKDEINKYLIEYLGNWNRGVSSLLNQSSKIKGFKTLSSIAVKTGVKIMAKTFIVGSTTEEAIAKIEELEAKGLSYTLDLLGELVVSKEEAAEHLDSYLELIRGVPNCNVSVKLSGLYSQIDSKAFDISKDALKRKLRIIYREAIKNNAFVNVDLEYYDWKDLTFSVFKEVLMESEFRAWKGAGIVVQAYLCDSREDLKDLIAWTKERGTPIMVRLVKGAYWDYEKTIAEQNHWPSPVFTDKARTDMNYEELTKMLFDNYKHVKPAIASHNIRSMSYALSLAKEKNLDKSQYEFQMLYGMLDSVKEYFVGMDVETRVYLPYGELIPGMAYLVRRLLENTANESFLKMGFNDNTSDKVLLQNPEEKIGQMEYQAKELNTEAFLKHFTNEADLDFSKARNRDAIQKALKEANAKYTENTTYPLFVDGEKIYTGTSIDSINPSKFAQVLGKVSMANEEQAQSAIDASQRALTKWSKLDVKVRAKVLKDTAAAIRLSRFEFNALLVLEGGKPWKEADGELSELVDFLEYYAAQAIDLFEKDRLISLPGERNQNIYEALGVSAIIPPWNFPLAIMGGMSAAALVAGNTVIIKPASQTPIVAYKFVEFLQEALENNLGKEMARGIVNYLPGPGSKVGNFLVEHPQVKMIAFTGSCEVGMNINKKANENPKVIKRIVAEMGGKNTIIVDKTADFDEAVPGVVYSAYGFAGQKCSACSRVVVLDSIYDQFVKRLVEAAGSIRVREASEPDCYLPSVIDEGSFKKVQEYIKIGQEEANMVLGPGLYSGQVPETGYFSAPIIFADVAPDSRLAQEEIFGPVLSVIRARDIDHAIEITNNTQFGLTGGLFSRSPERIEKVANEIEVGNFYINRPCTGAIVARQAFGGMKLSSIGFKAGGPHYLLNFVHERTITENTMRQGFVVD